MTDYSIDMVDSVAKRSQPRPAFFRHRALAFTGHGNGATGATRTNNINEKTEEQPLAADGSPIGSLRNSYKYDPLTDECYFRARKSSTASTGSRKSIGDESAFANDLRARKASLVKINAVKEEAAHVQKISVKRSEGFSEQEDCCDVDCTSTVSTGSRKSIGDESAFADDFRARKASKINAVKEEAAHVQQISVKTSEVSEQEECCEVDFTSKMQVGKIRKDSDTCSSIEEVECVPVEDRSVAIQYPFRKMPKEFVMELPSTVPLTYKDNEEPQSNKTKELAKETSCDHQTDNKSPHNSPVPSEQNNCTRTLVCDGLPCLTPVEELNHFSAAPPPCLCTVYIKNAENLLKPGSTHSYQTDPILIPRESKRKIGHTAKILVQVSSGHLSLAIILTTEGSRGRHLSWPFNRTVLFGLENVDKKENRERGFKCYGNGLNFKKCLGRPQNVENTPIGIRRFLPVQALQNGFITSNTLVLHCLIFSHDVELRTCTRQLSPTSFLNKKCLLSSFTITIR